MPEWEVGPNPLVFDPPEPWHPDPHLAPNQITCAMVECGDDSEFRYHCAGCGRLARPRQMILIGGDAGARLAYVCCGKTCARLVANGIAEHAEREGWTPGPPFPG